MKKVFIRSLAALAAATVVCCGSSCGASLKRALQPVKSTKIVARPASTSFTNLVSTNLAIQVTPKTNSLVLQDGSVTNFTVYSTNVAVTILTNRIQIDIPEISYSSNSLAPGWDTGARVAGGIAQAGGIPYASTGVSVILGLTTLIMSFFNKKNARRATELANGVTEKDSALKVALVAAQTLVENFEKIRDVAKTFPGYTRQLDDQIMTVVQLAQKAASPEAKKLIEDLVEKHTDFTWPGEVTALVNNTPTAETAIAAQKVVQPPAQSPS